MSEPRAPTQPELAQIVDGGFRPGASPGWWLGANGEPVATDDALWAISVVKAAYPEDSRAGRSPGRIPTEFWMVASVVLPCVGAGITAMTGLVPTLPAPWNVALGVGLTGAGAVVGTLYLRARTELKRRGIDAEVSK